MRRLTMLIAAGLLVAGCSGGDGESATTAPPTSGTTNESTTSQAPSTTDTAPPTTTASSTTQATTTTPPAAIPTVLETIATGLGDAPAMTVTVEGSVRPRFAWDEVDGAVRYIAVVVDDSGRVLWAWSGEANSVTVGAGDIDRDGVGARLGAPGWLQVVGLAPDGLPVATSNPTPVG